LCEFHEIYNVGTVGDGDELITFGDEKVKGQGHNKTRYGQISILGILKVMHSNFRVTDNFFYRGILVNSLP